VSPKVSCVVPARLASTRFPGKMLHPLLGAPLIVHTLRRAQEAGCFDEIVCLADAPAIREVVEEAGFRVLPTGPAANGTERIAKHVDLIRNDLIVNLQGDEPAFPAEGLRTLCAALRKHPDLVHLLAHEDLPSAADLANPNRVKIAVDALGFARDFVRVSGPVEGPRMPGASTSPAPLTYHLQSGAYGYSRAYLERYAALPRSAREEELSHEILRAAPHQSGWAPLRAHLSKPGVPVDVPADLAAAESALNALRAEGARPYEPHNALQGTLP